MFRNILCVLGVLSVPIAALAGGVGNTVGMIVALGVSLGCMLVSLELPVKPTDKPYTGSKRRVRHLERSRVGAAYGR